MQPYIGEDQLRIIREAWIDAGKPDKPQAIKNDLPGEIHYGIVRLGIAILQREDEDRA